MDPAYDSSPTTEPGPPNLARETLARSPVATSPRTSWANKSRMRDGSRQDHMERPTSALHLSRVTLDVRRLGREPAGSK